MYIYIYVYIYTYIYTYTHINTNYNDRFSKLILAEEGRLFECKRSIRTKSEAELAAAAAAAQRLSGSGPRGSVANPRLVSG
jgi:hypothetical protein